MKFSDPFIKNLKPASKKYYRREGHGFTIRVMPSGVKTWLFVYTFDGLRREMNLGHYPSVSLAEARIKFGKAYEMVENGKDPAAVEQERKDERRKTPTVADLIEEYLEKHAKPNKKSWKEDERALEKDVLPAWGRRKAVDIKKRDVILLLESIVERGAPVQSNNVLEVARKMFNFAVERDILPFSPFAGVKPLTPKVIRDRFLSTGEIATFWKSLDTAGMSDEMRRALKLILVTGQRPGEVIGMNTEEIDGRWWTIPGERTKNGVAQRVYLTDTALELMGDKQGYIFESPRGGKPIDENALARAIRNNCPTGCTLDRSKCENQECKEDEAECAKKNKLGVVFFRPHDLRRTAATHMAQIGILVEHIDRVLNHLPTGVIRHYNHFKYDREKQQALESWSRKLKSIVAGKGSGKVLSIRGGG